MEEVKKPKQKLRKPVEVKVELPRHVEIEGLRPREDSLFIDPKEEENA